MKKRLTSILVAILSLTLILACATGCGGKKGKIILSETTASMVVYDDLTLTYDLENIEGDVTWSSSDSTVVIVNDGVLTALKAGTATITAAIEDVSATCVVTVTASDYVPALSLGGISEVNLIPGGTYAIAPQVTYKGSPVQATFSYESGTEAVATVSSTGNITAVADGQATVTVKAIFKGTEIIETVTVNVQSTIAGIVTIDDVAVGEDVILSIEDEVTIDVSTLVNGAEDSAVEVVWSTEDDKVTIVQSGSSVTITGAKVGDGTIKVVYSKGSISGEREIAISVLKKIINKDTALFIDKSTVVSNACTLALPADVNVANIQAIVVGDVSKAATSVNQTENTITFDVSEFATGEIALKFETENYSYTFANTTIADLVIMDVAGLNALRDEMLAHTTEGKYYVLGADVDYGGNRWEAGWPTGAGNNAQFAGVLDGRGHKISNLNTRRGFVSTTVGGSVIKNVIFDITIVGSGAGGAVTYNNNGTIKNCVILTRITAGEFGVTFAGIAASNHPTGVIKNCFVSIEYYNKYDTYKDINAVSATGEGAVSNCYAISPSEYVKYISASTNSDGLYKTSTEFFAEVTSLAEEDGWDQAYWAINNGELTFNGVKIA